MSQFELSAEIPAIAEAAWQTLTSLPEWSSWNRLVPSAEGELVPGSVLHFKVRGPDGELVPLDPVVVSVASPRELVLEAAVGARRLVRLVHTFSIESAGAGKSILRQRWVPTEPLPPDPWSVIRDRLARWAELGDDLAAYLATDARRAVPTSASAAGDASPLRSDTIRN